jgi:hypothetical protein
MEPYGRAHLQCRQYGGLAFIPSWNEATAVAIVFLAVMASGMPEGRSILSPATETAR